MSDELIEGRAQRNRPPELPEEKAPSAAEGRKSRLKGKAQAKPEDEKSGPYVTLVPPDEAGDRIRAQADEPTFHKGMQPVVGETTPGALADPDAEPDSSAPASDLPWDVIEAAPATPEPEPEPEPEPAPQPPPARAIKPDHIMKLPRVPAGEAAEEADLPPVKPKAGAKEDFVPHFHTPTGEMPPVPDEVAPEQRPAPTVPVSQDDVDFIPHFHTPTGVLPAVPDEVEEDDIVRPQIDEDIPPIRRQSEDSLTPGVLRPVPGDVEPVKEIPPIKRGRRRHAPAEQDEDSGKSVALEDDTGGGLPRLRRMVDEVTGEVIDADWVREVGEGGEAEPPKREPKRQRGSGIEEKIAERLQARRAEATRKPAITLSSRTILTGISILASIALVAFLLVRLGVFGGSGDTQATPTPPAGQATPGQDLTQPAGAPTSEGAALDYQHGRLAFASNRDGNYEIYVMEMSTGALTRLTNDEHADRSPAWSPDGRQIAFVSNRSGNDDLYVIPAAGGTPAQLTTDPGSDRNPAWSPDGTKIVSTRENVDGSRLIALTTLCIPQPSTCEGQMKLLTPGGYDRFPSWAPSGAKLAFTASDIAGSSSVIAVLNPDGSGYQSFPGTKTADLSPAWSPDGTKIAFLSFAEGDYDLWIMYSDGTGVTQITKSQATDGAPGWSPSGKYIVFASDRDDKQHFNLYLIQTDCLASGTNCEDNLIRVTTGAADDLDPAWVP